MIGSLLPLLAVGFALGLHHAFDVDHLVAVLAIVSERRGLWRSSLVGVAWGVGHTTSLLVVALVTIGLHAHVPAWAAQLLELAVAVMLIALGARLLGAVLGGHAMHAHTHAHPGLVHAHPHFHAPGAPADDHVPSHRQPFAVGLVHGLAGSAGLMLSVAITLPAPAHALAFVTAFGCGSIAGMAGTAALCALPALAAPGHLARADRWVRGGAALASVAVGIDLALGVGRRLGLLLT